MKHMSNKEFDNQFREKLGDLSSTPSELNWIGIEGNLDAAESGKKRRWWLLPAIAAFLIAGGSGYFLFTAPQPSQAIAETQVRARAIAPQAFTIEINAEQGETSQLGIAQSQPSQNSPSLQQYSQVLQQRTNHYSGLTQKPAQEYNGIASKAMGSTSGDLDKISATSESANIEAHLMTPTSMGEITQESSEAIQWMTTNDGGGLLNADHSIKMHKLTGLYVGPSATLANTTTWSPALEDWATANVYLPKFSTGSTYGLALGYDFNSNFGIHTELQFNAIQNQEYKADPDGGRRYAGPSNGLVEFKASYTRIPVFFKYRKVSLNGITKRPSAIQYLLGFSYGRLNWVNLPDWAERVRPDQFNMHEWGIVGGAEYVFYLHQNYSLTLGLRGGYYGHISQFPVVMGPSPTDNQMLQVGVTARLQFHLPKADH